MSDGTPRATERSEGGSDKPHTSKRNAVQTERIFARVDKSLLMEVEDWVAASPERTMTQAIRIALRRFIAEEMHG